MKKFPVKIDLTSFFQDERKFVLILVDPQWKSVEYLQHRVEEIFDVRPVHFLTKDNLFIPPQESIEVVEYTESLKAYIPKHAVEESRRRSKNFANTGPIGKLEGYDNKTSDSNVEDFPISKDAIKKRKHNKLGTEMLSSSTPNHSKKSRRTTIASPKSLAPLTASNESQEITSTNDHTGLLKSLEVLPSKNCDVTPIPGPRTLIADPNVLENNGTTDEERGQNSMGKKKRKRVPKKRDSKEAEEQSVNSISIGPEIPSSTLLNNSKSVHKNSHIFFDDYTIVGNKSMQTTKHNSLEHKLAPKIIFKCELNEKDIGKPLVFPLNVINKTNKTRKPLIDIKENILLQPANIEGFVKENSKQDLNNELENNISLNTLNAVTVRTESKISMENVNTIETENNSESTRNETINNFEVSKDRTSVNNLSNIPNDVNVKEILDNISKDIATNPQIEIIKKKPNWENGKTMNTKAEIPTAIPFKETEDANNTKDETSDNECNLNKTQKENRKLKSKNSQDGNSIKENVTEELENSSALDESCVIDLDDDDEDVIDLSDADEEPKMSTMNPSEKLSETLNKSITAMSVEEMLPFCTPLTGAPKVGDVVIFKFNRKVLGEKTDVSEFIACKCDHINRRTKVLKLVIIDSKQENDVIPHQYAYNLDESINNDKYMSIKVSELIDPKVLET